MSGGTREHSLTAGNILGELRDALLDRPCEVHGPNMRVKCVATGRYVYPDVSVVYGRAKFEDATRDALLNPIVIVEVLSDSTEAYDRGDKFAHYETIPSVQDYVIASQREPRIDHFQRQVDGSWTLRILRRDDILNLDAVGCQIPVARAYLKVLEAPVDEP